MIAAIDIGPTILDHLGLPIPADMRGKPIRLDGAFDGASLRGLKARLVVIDSRRLPALAWLALTWALLLVLARLPLGGGDDRPEHGTRTPRQTAWAMRVGAIALLWAPVAVLLPAALEPSRTVEFALIVATCFALGALTDRLMPWPRAPLVPAVVAVVALTVDALAGTQLLMRSLLGPSPAFGARFYGIGNELKSGLAVLVFTAVAAALYPAARSRRAAATMACAGIVLAIVEGSARIGAGVGGVILVSAGGAVATVMLLPGTLNRKRVLIVMAAPVAGAGGARRDRPRHGPWFRALHRQRARRSLAGRRPRHHRAPLFGRLGRAEEPSDAGRHRAGADRLVHRRAPPRSSARAGRSDPAWLAAFAGGLTAGVIGALTEDSGPVLLVVAVFALGCVLSYLWGAPTRAPALSPSSQSTSPAERSHALRQSAAPSG